MQKLSVKLKNTPVDTSLVHCSVSPVLNRDQSLSVRDKVLADNNSEENLRLPVGGHKAITLVYILNADGKPLMPCKPAKARHLLKDNKAKVVQRIPFTIQLLWNCKNNVQPIILGIDPGYEETGFSGVSNKMELICGEVKLRGNVSKKITQKRMYRRTRRSKLWHREPKFNNRKKPEEWLAPSIQHKLDSHIRLIDKVKNLLPVSKVIVEVANFDTQKIQNPEISGVEYQQGELQGYEVKEYLLEKWRRKCAYCGKRNIPLEAEHIIPKSRGGTDRVSNLTLSCSKCNLKKGNRTAKEFGYPQIQNKAKKSLKSTTFMNIISWKLVNCLNCNWTYGYITKYKRMQLGMKKSHANDAFVIAGGNGQQRTVEYPISQVRRNNRSLQLNRKGFKPSIRRRRYNFQPCNLVSYNDGIYEVKGVFNKGTYIRLKAEKDINTRIENVAIYRYMRGMAIHSPSYRGGSLLTNL